MLLVKTDGTLHSHLFALCMFHSHIDALCVRSW